MRWSTVKLGEAMSHKKGLLQIDEETDRPVCGWGECNSTLLGILSVEKDD
jgi:hypothetical protein